MNESNGAFSEERFIQVISSLHYPNKCICTLNFSVNLAIPTSAVFSGIEYHLAPTVIYPEVFDCFHTHCNRSEQIIFTVTIWSKRRRYKYLGSGFKYFYRHIGGINTVLFIAYQDLVANAVNASIVRGGGVINVSAAQPNRRRP